MRNIFIGSTISIVISIILLLVFATLLVGTNIQENMISPVITIITAISIFIGSFIATIKIKKDGLKNGAFIGLIYVLSIYILSSIVFTGFELNLNSIIIITTGIVMGMLGGIVGVNNRKN